MAWRDTCRPGFAPTVVEPDSAPHRRFEHCEDIFQHLVEAAVERTGWSKPGAGLLMVKWSSSFPKYAVNTSTTEPLKQPCAAGYSGWFGVTLNPIHLGSATKLGFPTPGE